MPTWEALRSAIGADLGGFDVAFRFWGDKRPDRIAPLVAAAADRVVAGICEGGSWLGQMQSKSPFLHLVQFNIRILRRIRWPD